MYSLHRRWEVQLRILGALISADGIQHGRKLSFSIWVSGIDADLVKNPSEVKSNRPSQGFGTMNLIKLLEVYKTIYIEMNVIKGH